MPQEASVQDFPESAPAANPVFYRTYSRRDHQQRETWEEVCQRTVNGLAKLGQLSEAEQTLLLEMQRQLLALPSGRWMWIGGTPWMDRPENFSGAYNCTSTNTVDWRSFGLMMDLAMMGCGTGAILEPFYVSQLPPIRNTITIQLGDKLARSQPENDRNKQVSKSMDLQLKFGWVIAVRGGYTRINPC
jgi:ribonucleotide reductase class II